MPPLFFEYFWLRLSRMKKSKTIVEYFIQTGHLYLPSSFLDDELNLWEWRTSTGTICPSQCWLLLQSHTLPRRRSTQCTEKYKGIVLVIRMVHSPECPLRLRWLFWSLHRRCPQGTSGRPWCPQCRPWERGSRRPSRWAGSPCASHWALPYYVWRGRCPQASCLKHNRWNGCWA